MPNYDFRCKGCENTFSKRVSYTEQDQVKCPECGSSKTGKIFTKINIGRGSSRTKSSTGGSCGTCSGSAGCC